MRIRIFNIVEIKNLFHFIFLIPIESLLLYVHTYGLVQDDFVPQF